MPAIHPTVAAALENKATQSQSSPAAWLRAWHPLVPFCSTVATADQITLINQCDSADDLAKLAKILQSCRTHSAWLNSLIDAVDAQPVSLPQWLQALTLARQWLCQHQPQTKPSFQSLSSYLSCCAELYASQSVATSLIDTVQQLINDHGIDAGS